MELHARAPLSVRETGGEEGERKNTTKTKMATLALETPKIREGLLEKKLKIQV